jgi:hypothetical protein
MRARRSKTENVSRRVVVSLPPRFAGGLGSAERAESAEALLHHILFMRSQIPVPFRELQACVDEFVNADAVGSSSISQRKRSHMRKLQRYVREVNELCQGIKKICHRSAVDSISFMFGASAAAPREMVSLILPKSSSAPVPISSTDADGIKRKVIREVIGSFSDVPITILPSTSLFASVVVSGSSSFVDPETDYCPLFAVRDNFIPTLRKRGTPLLEVQLGDANGDAVAGGELGQPGSPMQVCGLDAENKSAHVLRRGVRSISKATAEALFK